MIPSINKIEVRKEKTKAYTLPTDYINFSGDYIEEYVNVFAMRLRKILPYRLVQISFKGKKPDIVFTKVEGLSEEEYIIKINTRSIYIESSSQRGFSNGLTTLFLLVFESNGVLKKYTITDKPAHPYRGFMMDVSRHFFPVDDIKKMIEQCGLLKLNKFHWHLSDDQGYRIESKIFPLLNTIGSKRKETNHDGIPHEGYYQQEEIRDIVKYASDRGIDVIPEIDLPGHTTALVASYPELGCNKNNIEVETKAGIFPNILCPGKDGTYEFISKLLDEVCDLFPYEYFHIGGDEVLKTNWMNCPDCKKVMDDNKLENYEQLQALMTDKIIAYLKTKNKKAICWNDAVASGRLDQSAIVQYWAEFGLKKGYTRHEVAKNRQFILSNYSYFYFDQSYAQIPLQATYSYSYFIRSIKKLPNKNILGVEAPIWTEYVSTIKEMEKLCFPRLLAVAERGWSDKKNYSKFAKNVVAYLKVLDLFEVTYTPYAEATISGINRINKLISQLEIVLSNRISTDDIVPHVPDSCVNDQEHNIIKMAAELYGVAFNKIELLILLLKLSSMQEKIKNKVKI